MTEVKELKNTGAEIVKSGNADDAAFDEFSVIIVPVVMLVSTLCT